MTREPGGTPAGERVRALLLDPGVELHPRAEALLFAAARAELVDAVIRPPWSGARWCCATATWTRPWPTRAAPAGWAGARSRRSTGSPPAGSCPTWWCCSTSTRPTAWPPGPATRTGSRPRTSTSTAGSGEAFRDLAAADPGRFAVIDAAAPVAEVATRVQAAVLALLEEP